MRILICSFDFYPRIGGTETAGMTLATGLCERGYQVTVVTATAGANDDANFPFAIVRQPGAARLLSDATGIPILVGNDILAELDQRRTA